MLAVGVEVLGPNANAAPAAAGASAQLVPANTTRNGLRITVDPAAAAPVYLLLGTGTASATNFHIALDNGTGNNVWDGRISGVALWRGAVQYFGTGAHLGVTEV